MDFALLSGNLECVKVMYGEGSEQHCSDSTRRHPDVYTVQYGQQEILRFVMAAVARLERRYCLAQLM
jgi:hypothetical protein